MKRKQTDSDVEKKKGEPAKKQKKEDTKSKSKKAESQPPPPPQEVALEDDEVLPGYVRKTIVDSKGKTTPLQLYVSESTFKPSPSIFASAEKALFPNVKNVSFPESYKHFLATYNGGISGENSVYIKPEALNSDSRSEEEKDDDFEPEPLDVGGFCSLFDVKKGREEDIQKDDEQDSDDDEDSEEQTEYDLVSLKKAFDGIIPENLLIIAANDLTDAAELTLIVLNVVKDSSDYGKVSIFRPINPDQLDDNDDDDDDDENESKTPSKTSKDPKKQTSSNNNSSSNDETNNYVLIPLANNFDEFLTIFMSKLEYKTYQSNLISLKLSRLEKATITGDLKQLIESYKRKFPLLDKHFMYMTQQFIKQQEDIFTRKAGIDPNHILFRLITTALFFLQKSQEQESLKEAKKNKKKNKKKTASNKESEPTAAAKGSEDTGYTSMQVWNWLLAHFLAEDKKSYGLDTFVAENVIEEVLNYPGAFEAIDLEEMLEGKEGKADDEEGKEDEDGLESMDEGMEAKYKLGEGRRRRMTRVLTREVESEAEMNGKWIKESGEMSEEGKEVMKKVFEKYDKDADGYLDMKEWNEYLGDSGEKRLTEEEYKGFVELVNFRLVEIGLFAGALGDDEDMMMEEEEEEAAKMAEDEGKEKKEKRREDAMNLEGWLLICADAIMMSPEKEKTQLEKIGFKHPVEKFL